MVTQVLDAGHEPEPQVLKLKVPDTATVCGGMSGTSSMVIVIGCCVVVVAVAVAVLFVTVVTDGVIDPVAFIEDIDTSGVHRS